ncbi:MAG: hypothetical protein WBD74_09250 [Candidatus Aquilonibacter sp.]
MADVAIENGTLKIKLSLLDQALAFHSSFEIPLSHITNAYVSDLEELQLQFAIEATNLGLLKTVGVFANPQGLIFADVGAGDCLVIATRGERFPQIAVQLPKGKDPNAVAHEIMSQLPDSGPVD